MLGSAAPDEEEVEGKKGNIGEPSRPTKAREGARVRVRRVYGIGSSHVPGKLLKATLRGPGLGAVRGTRYEAVGENHASPLVLACTGQEVHAYEAHLPPLHLSCILTSDIG